MGKISEISVNNIMNNAKSKGIIIPGFNILYFSMMVKVVKALIDTKSFGLIMVARLEWIKLQNSRKLFKQVILST